MDQTTSDKSFSRGISRMYCADKDADQLFLGRLVCVTEATLIQQIDAKTAVIHNPRNVAGWGSCDVGDLVTIRYNKGAANMTKLLGHEFF
jgi:hypothetical protein